MDATTLILSVIAGNCITIAIFAGIIYYILKKGNFDIDFSINKENE